MKAYLMHRDEHVAYGVAEWWKTEDDNILYVEFRADMCATIVFPYDIERDRVKSWNELGVWHKDMTGGRAMRELGYEPIEEDEDGTDQRRASAVPLLWEHRHELARGWPVLI